jgi:hypothetical protein
LVRPERFKRSFSDHDAGVRGDAWINSVGGQLTISRYSFGAGDGPRTRSLPITSRVLYRHELHQPMCCSLDCDQDLHAKRIAGL